MVGLFKRVLSIRPCLSLANLLNTTISRCSRLLQLYCSFSWLGSIPSCEYATSFSIRHPEDGHLGCFPTLAILNSAATNTGVCVFLNYGFLQVVQEWKDADRVALFLLLRNPPCWSSVAVPAAAPNSAGGLAFFPQPLPEMPSCQVSPSFTASAQWGRPFSDMLLEHHQCAGTPSDTLLCAHVHIRRWIRKNH